MFDFIAIPAIVLICWFVGFCINSLSTSQLATRLIPVICGVVGAVLAVIMFFSYPGIIPADDIFTVIAIGIVSGLSATGLHETIEQIKKI